LIYEIDNLNRTCLHYAVAVKEPKMVEILESLKIDASVKELIEFKNNFKILFKFNYKD
jgi:hypothetical protein